MEEEEGCGAGQRRRPGSSGAPSPCPLVVRRPGRGSRERARLAERCRRRVEPPSEMISFDADFALPRHLAEEGGYVASSL